MAQPLTENAFELTEIISNLVTEDDEPVDSLFSAKQQRLLARAAQVEAELVRLREEIKRLRRSSS